jgi:CDGSH-type Zn-finger protein
MSVKIRIRNNGPLIVEGDVTILDAQERPFGLAGRTTVGLCRCGHSASKPFCDGAHRAPGFADQCAARDLPPPSKP